MRITMNDGKNFEFYVAYSWSNSKSKESGDGSVFITYTKKYIDKELIIGIEDWLRNNAAGDKFVILNILALKETK
jgi:hypothetical protein